jgi:SAM-dependent methyltransferase
LVKAARVAFEIAEPVIEIGSQQYDLKVQDLNLRDLFPGKQYIGCDLSVGPGVDRVEDITQLTFKDAEVGTVVCLHILEYVWDVFAACRHIRRVVKAGGMALIVCPFNLHIHRFPKDYWRFTDDTMKKLMEEFPWLIVGRQGYAPMPSSVFAIGFNRESFPDFPERYETFKKTLERESFDPSSPGMRLRMWIGAGLFRKKYFQTFHARNELTLEVIKPAKS